MGPFACALTHPKPVRAPRQLAKPPSAKRRIKRGPPRRTRAGHVCPLRIDGTRPSLYLVPMTHDYGAPRDAKPHVVDDGVGSGPPTNARPNTPGSVGPPSSSECSVVPVPSSIGVVPNPLPDIAEHVMEAERVRVFRGDGLRAINLVDGSPGSVAEHAILRTVRPSPAGVLPLSLGRQAKPVGIRIPLDTFPDTAIRGLQTDAQRRRKAPIHRRDPRHTMNRNLE